MGHCRARGGGGARATAVAPRQPAAVAGGRAGGRTARDLLRRGGGPHRAWRAGGAELATAGTARLAEGGRLVLPESLPERAPRLHEAFDLGVLGAAERAAVVAAEEEHYRSAAPLTEDAVRAAPAPQFGAPDTEVVTQPGRLAVTRTLVERWFSASAADGSSYAALLRAGVP